MEKVFLLFVALALGVPADSFADTDQAALASAAASIIQGEMRTPGLKHPVRVQRDRWGVPHIYAEDQDDLFFAQGFVVAQDRLFQMELWKRSGQGRLAELLGPSAVERDINARRLRYRGDMQTEYSSYSADTLQILKAFTSGINAYIAEIQKPGGRGLPIEFKVAGFSPEPWKPEDCLNRLAAYSMMGNAASELLHAQALTLLGAEKASSLFSFDPHVQLSPVPGTDFSGLTPSLLQHVVSSDLRIPFPASTMLESNNWTVSGRLTESGRPLLANDPHRVIANPSLRYIVHLVAPGWDVIGAGEPGLPGVAAGHNRDIAWGFTIFGLDQQDLYIEELNPADPTAYRTPQGWRPLRELRETVHVRGAPDVEAVLRFSDHGPVLWSDSKRALALRWVGAEPGAAGYLGSLALDRARNWQEFEAAMPHWKVPSENIVYADRDGNIGEHSTGLAPLRKNFNGLLPLPADGRHEWSGFVPNNQLPHSYNPARGFIATANHKMIPDGYAYAVGYEWGAPSRFERISEVLGAVKPGGRKLTLEDMQNLQADVVSLPARRLQSLLRSARDASIAEPADLLLGWDCALTTDSAAAALYEFWGVELRHAVTQRAVPEAARAAIPTWSLYQAVAALAAPSQSIFGASPAAQRDAILRQTLKDAQAKLSVVQGADPKGWSWGGLHMAYFRHALDDSPGARNLFDPAPVARSGDGDVVQATSFDAASWDQVVGASYREIFDLSDWDKAVAINVPGQSGQPGAKHFQDLLPLWSSSRYFPLKYSRSAVDEVTSDLLILAPAR